FRDERAVDETLTMMFDEAVENNDYSQFIGGLDMGPLFIWDVYAQAATPAERVEEIAGTMQSLIDEANK
ncbi:MAG: ABC transporter substrate-binding protein, partial [Clostridiales bacterium]|nr:ABC transporter substrate-binding protein [Clostridiales bacterium]